MYSHIDVHLLLSQRGNKLQVTSNAIIVTVFF